MRRAATLAAVVAWPLLTAGACATTQIPVEPVVRIVEVPMPVPVPCVGDDVPAEPTYPDTNDALLAAPSAAVRYQLVAAGRELRIARAKVVEPLIKICRK